MLVEYDFRARDGGARELVSSEGITLHARNHGFTKESSRTSVSRCHNTGTLHNALFFEGNIVLSNQRDTQVELHRQRSRERRLRSQSRTRE